MTIPFEFATERLKIRQWLPADREPFAALNADPRVMEFYPETLDHGASDDLADRYQQQISEHGWGFWAVEIIASGQFIGFVGFNTPTANLPFSPCVAIGWRLAAEYWGLGYATEAAKAALHAGFEILGWPEIVSFTALSNIRSEAVMQRIGMHKSPAHFAHPSLPADHPLSLHCLYRLSRPAYAAGKQQAT